MYFVYLKGGSESERWESVLFGTYYPIYKLHLLFTGTKHNSDRPRPIDAAIDAE